MSNLSDIKNILDNQAERGIKSGDWKRLSYEIRKDEDGQLILLIEAVDIGIVFTKNGRLVGIYNFKE